MHQKTEKTDRCKVYLVLHLSLMFWLQLKTQLVNVGEKWEHYKVFECCGINKIQLREAPEKRSRTVMIHTTKF